MSENVLNQYIAKIEGHGCLNYKIGDNLVRVEIDEGERLFEKLVIGESYQNIAFITARICGVCPTAHTFAALTAAEDAFGVTLNDSILNLRYALAAAQIVQSHALHLYFLALPDYLRVKSGLELNQKNPRVFKLATAIKGAADSVIEVIGGRAVHPVTPTIGGFLKAPDKKKVEELIIKIKAAQRLALEGLDLFANLRYPYLKRETMNFSLATDGEVDLFGRDILNQKGIQAVVQNYQYVITEKVKPYSTAKFAEYQEKGLLVGALARLNLAGEESLNPKAKKAAQEMRIKFPIENTFKNNLAQALEAIHYLEEIERRLTEYLWGKNERIKVGFRVKAGTGIGAVEAPRGTLYHMYEFDEKGIVKGCDIMTPTVQNLTNLEADANEYLKQNKSVTVPRRERELEMLIRAYDPCITCSVH